MHISLYCCYSSIWSRGEIDLNSLENQLKTSLVHSLCDFVCEYYAFTAPLCEPPSELHQEMATALANEDQQPMTNSKGERDYVCSAA